MVYSKYNKIKWSQRLPQQLLDISLILKSDLEVIFQLQIVYPKFL